MNKQGLRKMASLFVTMALIFMIGNLSIVKADTSTVANINIGIPAFTVDGAQIDQASSASGKNLKATMIVENTSSEVSSANVVLAAFNGQAFIGAQTKEIELPGNAEEDDFEIELDLTGKTVDTIKLFAVSTDGSLAPGTCNYILKGQIETPTAPTNFRISDSNTVEVVLEWDAPAAGSVAGYELRRNGELIARPLPGTTKYVDTDFWVNGEYTYSLVAKNLKSEQSDPAQVEFVAPKGASIILQGQPVLDEMEPFGESNPTGEHRYELAQDVGGVAESLKCLNYMMIKAKRSSIGTEDNNLTVKIRYYDDKAVGANFQFQYNSWDNIADESLSWGGNERFKPVYVNFTGSNTWKTAIIQIRDARFNGLANGGDFRIRGVDTYYSYVQILKGNRYEPYPEGAVIMDMTDKAENGLVKGVYASMPVNSPDGASLSKAKILEKDAIEIGANNYAYVDIQDKYVQDAVMARFNFEYYDSGTGTIKLQYNSSDTSGSPSPELKLAEEIALTGTNEWKTARILVSDAAFANAANGYDFRIGGTEGPLYVRNIQAIKLANDGTLKNAPTSVVSYADGDDVQIKWNAVHDKFNVERYNVYKGAESEPELIYAGSELSFTVNGGAANIDTDQYFVSAEDLFGNESRLVPTLVTVKTPKKYYYDFATEQGDGIILRDTSANGQNDSSVVELKNTYGTVAGTDKYALLVNDTDARNLEVKVPSDVGKNVKITLTYYDKQLNGTGGMLRIHDYDDKNIMYIQLKNTEMWKTQSYILRDYDFVTERNLHLRIQNNTGNTNHMAIRYLSVESLTGDEKAEFSVVSEFEYKEDLLRTSFQTGNSAVIGTSNFATIDGVRCFQLPINGADQMIMFDINPNFINNSNEDAESPVLHYEKNRPQPEITLKITYYDRDLSGNNQNRLRRDVRTQYSSDTKENPTVNTNINFAETGLWKTEVVHLNDVSLLNSYGTQDWMLRLLGQGAAISKIEVIPGYVD